MAKAAPMAVIPGAADIRAPLITLKEYPTQPLLVTCNSPKPHRYAVWRMAYFFKREFGYDCVQYGYKGQETDELHKAYLWVHPEALLMASMEVCRAPCVGATCFRWRRWKDAPPGWAMQWIWIHPFFRRQGFLSRAWPSFRKEYGDFLCEPPLSTAMQSFLKEVEPTRE